MKAKFSNYFIVVLFLFIFFIFYKGLKNNNIYIPSFSINKDIPFFKAQIFDVNKQIDSDKIFKNDKFYLMNIWASWCLPCREEHFFLMDLSKQKNLEIIGLNYKDNSRGAKKFLEEMGNPYKTIILDEDGITAIEWGAYGVPESFLIYNQKIIKKIIGPLNEKSLLEIKKIVK